ncbi:PQQ-binding-like beta-propeller repeat protein [Streptomyces sp. NPDC003077]|uniref:serine/threonine-protein kinase n=1 Tax=Streptomyces sp. NPDC003077 TaxID=3154443 RepID=UPI0033A3FA2D
MPPQWESGLSPEAEGPEYAGEYRLETRLGSGGMGVVHLARSASGLRLAVKVIHSEYAQDPEFRARFRQEVAAARRVSGAFTAPVVDADTDGERPWMATLFIPGPTLSEHVKRNGPLAPDEVRRLASGLAEALRDIHRAGVVHRDLKPSNVLLAADGPKVIDFGISRPSDSEMRTETGKLIGTPPFMAPEQFQRPREVGPAADVFALGSVLVHAATGSGPFDSDSPYVVAYQVVHDEANLKDVPESLAPLIRSCLAKEPGDRPTPDALMRQLQVDVPTEVHGGVFADFLTETGRGTADRDGGEDGRREGPEGASSESEDAPGAREETAGSRRGDGTTGPRRREDAARAEVTHVRARPPATAARRREASPATASAGSGPGRPASGDITGRPRRRARRWATWTAVTAVLVSGGVAASAAVLDRKDRPALQTRQASAEATFHPWLIRLPSLPGRPTAAPPVCSYGAPGAGGPAKGHKGATPALFCARHGIQAARIDPEQGRVVWQRKQKEPPGDADAIRPLALSGGLLYVLSPDGSRLEALDPSAGGAGAPRWSTDLTRYFGAVRFVGDVVLLTSEDGTTTALDGATHRQLWRKRVPSQPLGQFASYGDPGTAYAAMPSDDGTTTFVTALDPRRGTVRWQRRLPGSLTPAGTGASGSVYFTVSAPDMETSTRAVLRFDPATGRTRRIPLTSPVDNPAAVVRGETVYLLGDGGGLRAVGERTWELETSVSQVSAPVAAERGDRLYFTGGDGRLLAVDTRAGALLGQTRPRLPGGHNTYLELVPAPVLDERRGRVYATAPDGSVFAVRTGNPGRW